MNGRKQKEAGVTSGALMPFEDRGTILEFKAGERDLTLGTSWKIEMCRRVGKLLQES